MGDFFSYEWIPILLNMSLTASAVILCVLLVRLLLCRAPRVFSYALWAVVLFRLLCPVSLTAGFSLLGLTDAPVRAAAGGVWLHGRAGELAAERLTEYGVLPEDVLAALPDAVGRLLEETL